MADTGGAFVPGTERRIEGRAGGPLDGLTFAAKDLFDVAGLPTGGGNPDWPGNDAPAGRHAWAVETLLEAGAAFIGKTVTDEVSLGILGESAFFGTPLNPAAPDRVPGGSSSGSASAVASGLADTALGTDTGGSVRVPSSFCGLYGIRPSWGRLDLRGMMAQAPGSDTTGWFARDAGTFARVSAVLLQEAVPEALPGRLLVAIDAFGVADDEVAETLRPMVERLGRIVGAPQEVTMALPGLSAWAKAQRTLQPWEAWLTFRDWLDRRNPRMAYSVARNLVRGADIAEADRLWASMVRAEARARLVHLLPPGTVLCLPTTPFPAPLKGLSISEQEVLRTRISVLASHGGLTGVPQVSLPGAAVDGLPVGLSIVGGHGTDAGLVALALAMERTG
ncbi:MAG: amidase [Alphaproteobacteria bacterium]|nr:amidase [Alphaproteobacteria bacterium]